MRESGLSLSSRISITMFATSSFLRGKTPLPQEPVIGFKTTGNPVVFITSIADSALKAKCVFGVGTLDFASVNDVINLLPQVSPTLNLLITTNPINSKHAVRYNPLKLLMHLCKTTSHNWSVVLLLVLLMVIVFASIISVTKPFFLALSYSDFSSNRT